VTQIKKLADKSRLHKVKKWALFSKITVRIVREQKLKTFRLFIYNAFHFPLMITIIWSMRRLLIEESIKNEQFLWIPVKISIWSNMS
jgi:YidC/Oxa1 family membrane protein insertase